MADGTGGGFSRPGNNAGELRIFSDATVNNSFITFYTNSTLRGSVDNAGTVNWSNPVKASQFRLSALNAAPSSASDTGTTGEIRFASGFMYLCTATNTWVRAALSTW